MQVIGLTVIITLITIYQLKRLKACTYMKTEDTTHKCWPVYK